METNYSSSADSYPYQGTESEREEENEKFPSSKKQKLIRKYHGSALCAIAYQLSWEKEYDFVIPSTSSKCQFCCKVCDKDVSVSHQGALDIQRHANGKMHEQRTAALRTQPKLGFKSSSDPVHSC